MRVAKRLLLDVLLSGDETAVHRDFCEVAICEVGDVRSAGRIAARPDALELFAQSLTTDDQVVLEGHGQRVGDRPDHRAARQARDRGFTE